MAKSLDTTQQCLSRKERGERTISLEDIDECAKYFNINSANLSAIIYQVHERARGL